MERAFALNYLSRFLLVQRLRAHLLRSSTGRVVLVASAGRYRDSLCLDDASLRDSRRGIRVSGRTQFANDLLAVELGERYRGTSVAATCVFPRRHADRRVPQRNRCCPAGVFPVVRRGPPDRADP